MKIELINKITYPKRWFFRTLQKNVKQSQPFSKKIYLTNIVAFIFISVSFPYFFIFHFISKTRLGAKLVDSWSHNKVKHVQSNTGKRKHIYDTIH